MTVGRGNHIGAFWNAPQPNAPKINTSAPFLAAVAMILLARLSWMSSNASRPMRTS